MVTAQKMGACARRDERQNQNKQQQKREKEEEDKKKEEKKDCACWLQKQVMINLYVVLCMVVRMVNS